LHYYRLWNTLSAELIKEAADGEAAQINAAPVPEPPQLHQRLNDLESRLNSFLGSPPASPARVHVQLNAPDPLKLDPILKEIY